jgi:hypothetical protein
MYRNEIESWVGGACYIKVCGSEGIQIRLQNYQKSSNPDSSAQSTSFTDKRQIREMVFLHHFLRYRELLHSYFSSHGKKKMSIK